MKGADQFHIGIVVDDLDAALAELSELFGYTWCPQMAVETPVRLPAGFRQVEPRLTALAWLGMYNWAYLWLHPEGPLSAQDVAKPFGEIFLRGIVKETPGTL